MAYTIAAAEASVGGAVRLRVVILVTPFSLGSAAA
jgi:hypothetical protein